MDATTTRRQVFAFLGAPVLARHAHAEAAAFAGIPAVTDASLTGTPMVPDGYTDNTAAFDALVGWAKLSGRRRLFVPHGPGHYRFASRPAPIPYGLTLEGEGTTFGGGASAGNGPEGGSAFLRDYTEPDSSKGFLTWDGAESGVYGLGGGLRDMRILAAANATGGVAILVAGSDADHRTGWMQFRNVGVSRAAAGGSWFRCMDFDGSRLDAVPGIRDTVVESAYLFCATDSGASIRLHNVVNFRLAGGGTFVPASGQSGLTVTGSGPVGSSGIVIDGFVVTGPGGATLDGVEAASIHGLQIDGGLLTVTPNAHDVVGDVLLTHGGTKSVAPTPGVRIRDQFE